MRKFLMAFIAFLVLALPINGEFTNIADAASTRVAVIKELKGTVKVKKAGGSKEFTAFAKMSLNEGDVLSVGSGGSAVLQFANGTSEDDKMTVSANTKLSFSKLSNKKGTTTKVSMWRGNAWVDVKSIANPDDEFTLETPTAVMGVRGTHLLVAVDSVSGATHLTVAAGVVTMQSAASENKETLDVYPTENALVTKEAEDNGGITIAPVDLGRLMQQSDASIVEAIVKASGEVVKENKEKLNQYFEQSGSPNVEDDARHKSNIENLLGAIVDKAVKAGLITQDRVNKLVAEAESQTGVGIDLTKKEIKLSEEEKLRQEEQKRKGEEAKKAAEEQKMKEEEERQKKNAELVKQLEEQRKQQEAANAKRFEEKQRRALELYEKQLSELDKKRFTEDKNNLNGGQPSSSLSSDSGSGSSSSPSSSPTSSSSSSPSSDPGPTAPEPLTNWSYTQGSSGGTSVTLSVYQTSVNSFAVIADNGAYELQIDPVEGDGEVTVKQSGVSITPVGGKYAISPLSSSGVKRVEIIVYDPTVSMTKTYYLDLVFGLTLADFTDSSLQSLNLEKQDGPSWIPIFINFTPSVIEYSATLADFYALTRVIATPRVSGAKVEYKVDMDDGFTSDLYVYQFDSSAVYTVVTVRVTALDRVTTSTYQIKLYKGMPDGLSLWTSTGDAGNKFKWKLYGRAYGINGIYQDMTNIYANEVNLKFEFSTGTFVRLTKLQGVPDIDHVTSGTPVVPSISFETDSAGNIIITDLTAGKDYYLLQVFCQDSSGTETQIGVNHYLELDN